jgi:hypothetical protein
MSHATRPSKNPAAKTMKAGPNGYLLKNASRRASREAETPVL